MNNMLVVLGALLTAAFGGGTVGVVVTAMLQKPKIHAEAELEKVSALAALDPIIGGWIKRLEHDAERLRAELESLQEEVRLQNQELRVERAKRRAYEAALYEHRINLPEVDLS